MRYWRTNPKVLLSRVNLLDGLARQVTRYPRQLESNPTLLVWFVGVQVAPVDRFRRTDVLDGEQEREGFSGPHEEERDDAHIRVVRAADAGAELVQDVPDWYFFFWAELRTTWTNSWSGSQMDQRLWESQKVRQTYQLCNDRCTSTFWAELTRRDLRSKQTEKFAWGLPFVPAILRFRGVVPLRTLDGRSTHGRWGKCCKKVRNLELDFRRLIFPFFGVWLLFLHLEDLEEITGIEQLKKENQYVQVHKSLLTAGARKL